MKTVRVRFQWFEKNFDIRNNLLVELLKAHEFDVILVNNKSAHCDIEIVGTHKPFSAKLVNKISKLKNEILSETKTNQVDLPFDYDLKTSNFGRRIWYTTENLRPPAQEGFDGALSFDQDDFQDFNAYCPSWYGDIGINWAENNKVNNSDFILSLLKTGRKLDEKHSERFGGFSNHLNSLNSFTISALKKICRVEVFSPRTNKPLYKDSKINGKFQFILCPEVDFYPGYVTKVLFEAYIAGAVPIYFGDIGLDENINRRAFINFKDFSTIADLVSYVTQLDFLSYKKIYEQPLLLSTPSLSKIVGVILG